MSVAYEEGLRREIMLTPKRVDCEQGTREWHGLRRGRLTGSKFATALGLNPYESRAKYWRQLTGREEVRDISGLPAVRWGSKHESAAMAAYASVTANLGVQTVGFVMDAVDPFIAYSPDGFAGDPDEHGYGETLLEFKCPHGSGSEPKPRLYEEIPSYYMPQIQGGADVCRRTNIHFACYMPEGWGGKTGQIAVWEVEPNKEYQAIMREGLREFYNHIVTHTPPPRTVKSSKTGGYVKPKMPEVKVRELYRGPVSFGAAL